MNLQNEKCVMIIDENLPLGNIVNTAAIFGVTLGKVMPEVVGDDVIDADGNIHMGIIAIPIPILRGNPQLIKEIRQKLYEPGFEDVTVVDFPTLPRAATIMTSLQKKDGKECGKRSQLLRHRHVRAKEKG